MNVSVGMNECDINSNNKKSEEDRQKKIVKRILGVLVVCTDRIVRVRNKVKRITKNIKKHAQRKTIKINISTMALSSY